MLAFCVDAACKRPGQRESGRALGARQVSYDAATGRGRRFSCTVFTIPGLTPIDKPTYNDWECHPPH